MTYITSFLYGNAIKPVSIFPINFFYRECIIKNSLYPAKILTAFKIQLQNKKKNIQIALPVAFAFTVSGV